jgi:hypothetical protein
VKRGRGEDSSSGASAGGREVATQRLRHKLTSTDLWERAFGILAVPGMVALLVGAGTHHHPLILAGALLSAPLMIGGALAFLVAVPYLLRPRRGRS